MQTLNEAFKGLDWSQPAHIQEQARKLLILTAGKDLGFLVLPPEGKNYWENSATVLVSIGRPRIDDVLQRMFEWLKDLNWPGARIVFDYLDAQPIVSIRKNLDLARQQAEKEGDVEWQSNLALILGAR